MNSFLEIGKYAAVCYLFGINLLTFAIYGWDKWKARKDQWRIPEKRLLLLAAFGGSIGAAMGMYVFRHKIRKLRFAVGIPVIMLLQAAAVAGLCRYLR